MTDKNKTGYEWLDMIPKQHKHISPKIKELQSNLEVISKKNDFKNSEVQSELEVLKNRIKDDGYNFQENENQIKQNYSSKFDGSQEVVTRESILKQSKEKPNTSPRIEASQAKFQDSGISSNFKKQQKSESISGSVKSLTAKFESLSNTQESKIDTNRKIEKLSDNHSRKNFMARLDKEMNQKNDAGRGR